MVGVGSYIQRREKEGESLFFHLFVFFNSSLKRKTTKPPVFYNFKLFNFFLNKGLNK